jgi:hypothetical protein
MLEKIVNERLEYIVSVNGYGIEKIIEIVGKGTPKIEAKSGLDALDAALGIERLKK